MKRDISLHLTKSIRQPLTQSRIILLLLFVCKSSWCGQISFLINPSSALQQEAYYEMVMDFEKQNPDTRVRIIAHKPEQFRHQINNFLQTGEAPADIMMAYAGIQLRTLQQKELISSLDNIWPENHLQNSVTSASFKAISIEEEVYALPLSYYQWGIYLNKSVFQKFDLTPPKTLSELLSVITTLRANNIIPFSFSAKTPWTLLAWLDYLNLRINGSEFHRDMLNGKISFHDERMAVVLDWWQKLVDAEAFHQTGNLTWEQSLPYLYRDLTAMMLMGNFFLAQVPQKQQERLSFIPFPYAEHQSHICEDVPLDVLILAKQAGHNKDAQNFLRFVSQPDTQQKFNHKVGKISPHLKSKVQQTYFIQEGRKLIESAARFNHFFDRETAPEFANGVAQLLVASVRQQHTASELLTALESLRKKYLSDQ